MRGTDRGSNRDPDLGRLEPGGLEKLHSPGPVTALQTYSAFHQALQSLDANRSASVSAFHETWLARKYRIVEWEFFVRNLVETRLNRKFAYRFGTDLKKVEGLLPSELRFELLHRSRGMCASGSETAVDNELRADLDHFGALKKRSIVGPYPMAHFEMFLKLGRPRDGAPGRVALLFEDGELTFCSLLWLLRRVGAEVGSWLDMPEQTRQVRFVCINGDPGWDSQTFIKLAEQCGIIVVARDGRVVTTWRWNSLVAWLSKMSRNIQSMTREHARQVLPIKRPQVCAQSQSEFDQLLSEFAIKMEDCFRKSTPSIRTEPLGRARTITAFINEEFKPLFFEPFKDLLTAVSPVADPPGGARHTEWKGHDHCLIVQSRPSFLPWEFLLRSWQPYRMNLLVLPVGFVPLTPDECPDGVSDVMPLTDLPHEVPQVLAFATIAGRVPPDVPSRSGEDGNYEGWLAAYWPLLQGMANEWTLDQLISDAELAERARFSEDIREAALPFVRGRGQLRRLVKAASGLLKYVDPLYVNTDTLQDAGDEARKLFPSNPALRKHSVAQRLALPDAVNREDLERLIAALGTSADEADLSGVVVNRIAKDLRSAVDANNLKEALLTAKALARESVTCKVFGCTEDMVTIVSMFEKADGAKDYLRQFVAVAFEIVKNGTELSLARRNGQHFLTIKPIGNWQELSDGATRLWQGEHVTDDGGTSAQVAILLRGVLGSNNHEELAKRIADKVTYDERDAAVSFRVNTRDEMAEQ